MKENKVYEKNYVIKLKTDAIDNDELGYMFKKTICYKLFKAKLLQSGWSMIFEICNSNEIAIIPCKWIEWMAPENEEVKENG